MVILLVDWRCYLLEIKRQNDTVVVVRIFNATRHPRHIEAAAIVMYMYLYSLAFMDHPCTLGATVCHQVPPYPLYTQPRACLGKSVLFSYEYENAYKYTVNALKFQTLFLLFYFFA